MSLSIPKGTAERPPVTPSENAPPAGTSQDENRATPEGGPVDASGTPRPVEVPASTTTRGAMTAPADKGVPVRGAQATPGPTQLRYRVVRTLPHDAYAYTQGLLLDGNTLLESTGLWGESSLRRVDLATGRVERLTRVDDYYFAEGLARVGDRLVQLTWEAGVALEYDAETLRPTGRTFSYKGEGWGLAFDGTHLIHSDGSADIRFRDPETFEVARTITVRDERGRPVDQLNELEVIDGQIFANIWMEPRIARISPETGKVTGWLDLSALQRQLGIPLDEQDAVLNGIAYDAETGHLFVTGKLWPTVFEIELLDGPADPER